MRTNKILGYIFLVLAILFTLSMLGRIPQFVGSIANLFADQPNGFESGRAFGTFLGWIIQIALTIALWIYGIRWTGKKAR